MVVLKYTRPVLVALGIRWDVSPTPSLFVSVCGTVNSLLVAQKSQNFDMIRPVLKKTTRAVRQKARIHLPHIPYFSLTGSIGWTRKQVFRT